MSNDALPSFQVFSAVIALVGVAAQSGLGVSAQQIPTYFPKPDNLADNSGVGCQAYKEVTDVATFDWPVYGQPNNAAVCINFPGVGWLLHEGENVDCANNCCRWLPPPSNSGKKPTPLPPSAIAWYEISAAEECTNNAKAAKLPKLANGNNDDVKYICTASPEDPATFTKTEVLLRSCSGNCCVMLSRAELDALKAAAEAAAAAAANARNPKQN